jgi:NADP-dependent 3-hydroxy acid dehydrogenase YdfG
MDSITNKVAIVTGASKGIGKAIAWRLAMDGCRVVLAARSTPALNATAEEFAKAGLKAEPIPTDLTDDTQVAELVRKTIERFGKIDILVNNAGMGVFKPFTEMDLNEFDQMWKLNVRAVFSITKSALPHMLKARSGEVVNICSLAGKNSFKGGTGYGATKWALRGFAASLMLELREANIRVMTIFPGSVDTSFSSTTKRGDKITQPEDVADAVLFAVKAPGRSMFSEIDLRPTNPN